MKSSGVMTSPQDLKKSLINCDNIVGGFFSKFVGPSQNTYINFKIQFQRQSV